MSNPSQIDDRQLEIFPFSPVCSLCKHRRLGRSRACAAFPAENSIPLDIWQGDNPHTTPVDGDHGIVYQPVTYAKPVAHTKRPKKK